LQIGQIGGFSKKAFFRGVTLAPDSKIETGNEAYFKSDIVIEKGNWIKGKTVYYVTPALGMGDVILKGANAVDTRIR